MGTLLLPLLRETAHNREHVTRTTRTTRQKKYASQMQDKFDLKKKNTGLRDPSLTNTSNRINNRGVTAERTTNPSTVLVLTKRPLDLLQRPTAEASASQSTHPRAPREGPRIQWGRSSYNFGDRPPSRHPPSRSLETPGRAIADSGIGSF